MPLQHIAIIMDGNGRWAKARGLSRPEGHRAGAENARRITRAAGQLKVPWLTLYALSTENLGRPQEELNALAKLLRHYLTDEVAVLIKNRVRLQVIGDRNLLGADLRRLIAEAEKATAANFEMTLQMAVCYGGRDEIVRAANKIVREGGAITEKKLSRALDTGSAPDPDLIIRTGGDQRLSNFLLWQAAYAELYFTNVLWPDFSPRHLRAAAASFAKRERRFGQTDDAGTAKPRRTFK